MRANTTLGNLIEHVQNLSAGNFDETVPLSEIDFASLEEMWVGGVAVEVLPQAQQLISNRLRVPYTYLRRCNSSLQSQNLNFWLEQERKERDTFFCRFNGRQQVRAVFTERYTAIDHAEILVKMLELGFRENQAVDYLLDDSIMVVKVLDYAKTFEVAFKDNVVPGISIGNSEIGTLSFCIDCVYFRIVCSNGMVVPVTVGQSRFKHISRKAFEELPDTIRQVTQSSEGQRAQMLISVETPVNNPIQSIESFNRRFGLTLAEGELVKAASENEPRTMWGLVQAYTAAAKSDHLTSEQAYRLERTGGMILSMVK